MFGIILLTVGVVLYFVKRRQQNRAMSLKSARKVSAAELQSTARAVADEIGGGDWRDYVKLWGEISVEKPLLSDLKQQPCVYYEFTVQREYEETVRQKNADGEMETRTQRGTEVLSSHSQSIPFYLHDGSGKVWVEPEEADIETVEVVNEFQPGEPGGGLLSYGRFKRTLSVGFGTSDRRTLGYRYRESVLPVGRSVLVVGSAGDQRNEIAIAKPLTATQHFIISLKPDEALTQAAERNSKWASWSMIGCLSSGLLLTLIGLLV
ncbi:E3 ubiquitin ligase family protein [Pseudanabaena sp. FACHB-2040]|uniref:E3 ubiquitin ligase family protein n=1 Tax=Pseudanabaena sp. FACHB-2040 TaxID=2692859 RepID=UPI001681DCEF|nr:E3 ubiquitin ligase family protein [Pseudanabaena sp. FACHB-2040]MBD2257877.1 E3 ubiquitin ligase [Pseudanabaena sp. FACHB-2040]